MTLYEKVKMACAEKKITVSELEESLGFARSTIYKWDKNAPSIKRVDAVAKKLNKPLEYFSE